MSRYSNQLQFNGNVDEAFQRINEYLTQKNYEYVEYDGEKVYKKGKGFLTAPSFIKVQFVNNCFGIEGWIKYALFPGVYIGEMDTKGFYGAAVKRPLADMITHVEAIILNCNAYGVGYAPNNIAEFGGVPGVQNTIPGTMQNNGMPVYANGNNTPNSMPENRRDYIKNYAPISIKKDLKNLALISYLGAAVTLLVSILTGYDIIGIVEAVVLCGLTVGMHIGKSKICGVMLSIVSFLVTFLSFAQIGVAGGFLWIIIGILTTTTFNKIDKQYKAFKTEGNNGFINYNRQ